VIFAAPAMPAPVLWLVAPTGILDVGYAPAAVADAMTVVQLVVPIRVMAAPVLAEL